MRFDVKNWIGIDLEPGKSSNSFYLPEKTNKEYLVEGKARKSNILDFSLSTLILVRLWIYDRRIARDLQTV